MTIQTLILLAVVAPFLTGCFNGDSHGFNISLGDVSLGQQLIDLKRARDENAITEAEYQRIKSQLLDMLDAMGGDDDDDADADDDHRHDRHRERKERARQNDEDDDFRWF